nr:immunoglobulin heavy chain junction region [Macaca mulatta]MOV42285.1 immunoglobulin heavy chain junction region [Macaca mulatta]MOV43601.1 immunoglobulin heavy chain junction region [Macaca mulatta]MOV43629.1 immunoglobulin heavy chain junction region [Macaca mulatta]MOV44289.1 immunoglobulin heavy chain junction region [Macaca mulatta]
CARDGHVVQYLDWLFPEYFDFW